MFRLHSEHNGQFTFFVYLSMPINKKNLTFVFTLQTMILSFYIVIIGIELKRRNAKQVYQNSKFSQLCVVCERSLFVLTGDTVLSSRISDFQFFFPV